MTSLAKEYFATLENELDLGFDSVDSGLGCTD
jgi:hypothetical protein